MLKKVSEVSERKKKFGGDQGRWKMRERERGTNREKEA
jgi:hypothetical protein